MISPCSVIRSPPPTLPGGCARIASNDGPPPRPTVPPRPWKSRSVTRGRGEHGGEPCLGAVERPVRRQVAAVLVAVRVAEHHFLHAAPARHQAAIRRQRERRPHHRRRPLEVVDGLEQRDDVQRRSVRAREPRLLQQHRDLEQVRHRRALGDHVMRQRRRAVVPVDPRGGGEDRELGGGPRRVRDVRRRQQPRAGELAREQRHARLLAERRVARLHAGAGEELADDGLVDVAVLPQVERGQVKAEHVDRAPERREPTVGEQRGAVPPRATRRSSSRSAANSPAAA